jgi:hypothetical protein
MGQSPDAYVRFGIDINPDDRNEKRVPAVLRYDGPDTGLSEDELERIQGSVWEWLEETINGLPLDHPGGFEIGTTGSFDYGGGHLIYATAAPEWHVAWSETTALPRELPDLTEEYAADFLAIQQALQVEEPQEPTWLLSALYG